MLHTNLAFIRAKPGRSEALGQALLSLVPLSRAEDGCLSYDIFHSKDDPDLWMALDEWRSADHLAAHFRQPHMIAFADGMSGLVEGDLDLRSFERHSPAPESSGERGRALLRQIGGDGWDGPITALAETSPAFAGLTVAYPYGDVLSRPGLDLRSRQICTVSMLMAQGSLQAQLRFHMDGLLNVGGSVEDLVDLLVLATSTLGFPVAIDAVGIVRAIVKDRGIAYTPAPTEEVGADERHARGVAALRELLDQDEADHAAAIARISPAFARWSVDFAFGDVLAHVRLGRAETSLAIISMLATSGNQTSDLSAHIRGALRGGVAREQIVEVLIQLSAYAGFPTALNAFGMARGVFDEDGKAPFDDTGVDSGNARVVEPTEDNGERRKRGLATLAVTSGAAGDAVVHSFDDLAPEIGSMIVDHSYGDIFSRPGLDPKVRELTACAALVGALTSASETPLRVHVAAALAVGATHEQIVETLLNVTPYRGFPAVRRALAIAGEALAKAKSG